MARLFEAALAWELAAGRRAQPADEAEVRDAVGRWAKRQPQRRPKLPVRHEERQDALPSSCRPRLLEHRKSTQYSLRPISLHRPYAMKTRPAWSF
jgi:hypothetical protein